MISQNRIKTTLILGLAALGLLTACASPTVSASSPRASDDASGPKTIVVSGNGVAYGQPDIATIQIGVNTRDADPGVAVNANSAKTDALLRVLKGLGIADTDLQTSNFSVNAQQDYGSDGQPKGTVTYFVDNTLTVKIRDLDKLSDVLGGAVDAGANNIYGISFGVADQAKLEAEARDKAVADAKTRAEQLAKAAGVKIIGVLAISEGYPMPVVPLPYAARQDLAASNAAVPVATGELQVNLQVSIIYEIE